jgi:hypothetical protein
MLARDGCASPANSSGCDAPQPVCDRRRSQHADGERRAPRPLLRSGSRCTRDGHVPLHRPEISTTACPWEWGGALRGHAYSADVSRAQRAPRAA